VPATRPRIGLLFSALRAVPHLTVAQNIAFGLRRCPQAERARQIEQQLAARIWKEFASRYPLRCRAANSSAWRWRAH